MKFLPCTMICTLYSSLPYRFEAMQVNNAESRRSVWLISRMLIYDWLCCLSDCRAPSRPNVGLTSSFLDNCCWWSSTPSAADRPSLPPTRPRCWPVCSVSRYLASLAGWNGMRSFDQLNVTGPSPNASQTILKPSPLRMVSALNEFLKCAGTDGGKRTSIRDISENCACYRRLGTSEKG